MFDQPSRAGTSKVVTSAKPMTPLGLEITARIKEMFHGFSNRMERNQQATLGPSEIGTPCDRRIAMSLMRLPPVNPGGDNWASFVGTMGHEGMGQMLEWANAGSGRYASELRMTSPSKRVPHGTTDLIDRVLLYVGDFKFMGQWSLDKLKTEGPSPTYRVQAHTYAFMASLRGETIKHVAIIGMPRDKSNLDDMYVWTEPYNPQTARDALARVDRIGEQLDELGGPDGVPASEVPGQFPIDASDCRFCPFHKPNSSNLEWGCNGRN
ncbi:hypothetical protein [Streptomyces sp. NPDC002666]